MPELFPILSAGHRVKEEHAELRKHGVTFAVVGLPWEMITPHAAQAKKNHGQTLERLAERGGLSACEALAVLDDRAWFKMPGPVAEAQLTEAVLTFRIMQLAMAQTKPEGTA